MISKIVMFGHEYKLELFMIISQVIWSENTILSFFKFLKILKFIFKLNSEILWPKEFFEV